MNRLAWLVLLVAPGLVVTRCSNGGTTPDGGTDATTSDAGQDAQDAQVADVGPDTPGCSAQVPCVDDAAACCNAFCTYLNKDPKNCGSCGTACGTQQFCNGQACFDAVVSNLCHNAAASIVLDGLGPDEDAGATIGAALAVDGGCTPGLVISQLTQGTANSIDDAGRPLLGPGNTYVAPGGPFGQKAVAFMTTTHEAPVYITSDSTSISLVRSSDNGVIIQAQNTALTAHHDYFVTYTAVEPQSGTLLFTIYGFFVPGTNAGIYWFQSQAMPSIGSYSKSFYVYEWTDTNSDGIANAGDTITLVGSG